MLVAGHDMASSPCGYGTPYQKLIECDAQVLFIGVDLSRNTLFHTMETIAGLDYALATDSVGFEIEYAAGNIEHRRFRLHQQEIQRRFAEIESTLVERKVATIARAGKARVIHFRAGSFAEVVLKELKKNPRFLLAQVGATTDTN